MNGHEPFAGSYRATDVSFLLKRIDMQPMRDLDEKERLIQSGQRHYSELVSIEPVPSPAYLGLFQQAIDANLPTMARDLIRVARIIRGRRPQGIVLVSLARAGTPVGVALKRLFFECVGIEVLHYSISIIRGRGIDTAALDYICARHDPRRIAFVDGWTGKGAITGELHRCIPAYARQRGVELCHDLFVLTDLAGTSGGCGSTDDYLIPSSILNATVSGLVSRTVLNEHIGPGDFHGCIFYDQLAPQDRSQWFVDTLMDEVHRRYASDVGEAVPSHDLVAAARRSAQVIADLVLRYAIADPNFIKPGIAEATRSLLRRAPRLLCLADDADPATRHLRILAAERGVPVVVVPDLPLKAATVIKDLGYA